MAERRDRLTPEKSAAFIELIEASPITTDAISTGHVLHETIAIARDHGFSSHGAAYLELAVRTECPLSTGNAALRRAANRRGHPLV